MSYGRSGKRVGFNPPKLDNKDREAMAKFRRPAYYQQAKSLVAVQGRQLEDTQEEYEKLDRIIDNMSETRRKKYGMLQEFE